MGRLTHPKPFLLLFSKAISMPRRPWLLRRSAAVFPLALLLAAGARAADVDPAARSLLDRVAAAYQNLSSFAATVEVQEVIGASLAPGSAQRRPRRVSVVIQRPDRAVVSARDDHGLTRAVTDGVRLQIISAGRDEAITPDTADLSGGRAIPAALGRGGAGDTCLAALLAGRGALAPFAAAQVKDMESLVLEESGASKEGPMDVVVAGLRKGTAASGGKHTTSVRFIIGKKDDLLRQVIATGLTDGGAAFTRTETYTDLRVNPILPQQMFVAASPAPAAASVAATAPASAPGPAPGSPGRSVPPGLAALRPVPGDTNGPISPEPGRYDFGQVSLLDATRIEHAFPFKNTGSAPLTIARLSASCGCISTIAGSREKAAPGGSGVVSVPPYPTLAPGEETTIQVAVNLLPLRPGTLRKSVSVFVEGNPQPVARYEIAGTLLPTVTFSPPLVDFGPVRLGEGRSVTLTATLDARLTGPGAPALPPLAASHPAIHIQPVPDRGAPAMASARTQVRTYTLSLAPDAPLGAFTGSLAFAPASAGAKASGAPAPAPFPSASALAQSSVLVVGQVVGAVSAQPQALAFGVVPAGQGSTRQVVLTGASQGALKNRNLRSDSPWLTLAPAGRETETAPPGSETIVVTLRPDAPAGVLQAQLTVTLENGQRLLLPVSAYVTAITATPARRP